MVEISVVIPAYRSAASLPVLLERLTRVMEATGRSYEIIVVDDGSPDETWRTLQEQQKRFPGRLLIVQLTRNFGQHNALMCGLRRSEGRIIATLDDDLQHRPEDLPQLLKKLDEGRYDLVYGGYRIRRHNFLRNVVTIPVLLFYEYVFRSRIAPTSFRVVRRELVESILHYRHAFTVVDGLLAWQTNRIGRVYIEHCRRAAGRSTYTLPKLVALAFDLFTNFSIAPLRALSAAGLLFVTIGSLAMAWYWSTVSEAPAVIGQGSLLAVLAILAGIQLLGLGLLGEYIGRSLLSINGKPQYAVRQTVDDRRERAYCSGPAAEKQHPAEHSV